MFVVEGTNLLTAALDAGAEVESVFVDAERWGSVEPHVIDRARDTGIRVHSLAPGVVARVASTVNPQPVLSIVSLPAADLSVLQGSTFVVVCADVRDPGNAGTVIRSADASGADSVIFCGGSVDPWNTKTVRASAGSVFNLPVVADVEVPDVLAALEDNGLARWGAVARGGVPHVAVNWKVPSALILGNEAQGLPKVVEDRIDGGVTIEMAGRAESLNVSMACSVICFEALRQRSG